MIVGRKKKKASIIANKRVASDGLGTDSPPPHNFSIVSYAQHVFSSVAVALASLQHQSINPLFLIKSGCGHSSALREVSRSGQQRNFFLLIFDVAASGSRQSTDGALFVAFNGWHTASGLSLSQECGRLAPRYHRKIREPQCRILLVMLTH